MLSVLQALKNESITNIKELQKSPSRRLKGLTRVMRGSKTLGFFLDEKLFEDLTEDLEAISSPRFVVSISKARAQKKAYSLADVKKRYGVN